MDSKELRGLVEAYSEVYAPQEIDEAVKGASPHTMQMRKSAAAERKAGIKPLPAKEGEKYAKYKMAQMAYSKRKRGMDEELDIFDVVLEFLQAEGFAETLEEAEWMMANILDEEAIEIILGEGHGSRTSFKKQSADERGRINMFKGSKIEYTPHKNYDPEANRGQGQILRPNQAEKQRRKKLAKAAMGEEVEAWVNALVEQGYDLSEYTWDEMYDIYEGEKPFPYEKVTAQQKKHTAAGRYGNMIKMGMAKRRAKEAEKTGVSQQDAGKGWYHAKEDYVNEAQAARENPEKYEREQSKKYAPVRGERTPMPPRGDKRREDFEKWYRANVR